jgi:hypothetical protein
MNKIEIIRGSDPLGYAGNVVERLRAMAEDELAGVNDTAVREEVAVLRARLGLQREDTSADGLDQGR